MPDLRFADRVRYRIPGHACPDGEGYVGGEMAYSDAGSVVLLVGADVLGMPINAAHCEVLSSGHDTLVGPLRVRYLETFPDSLKP